MSVSRLDLVRSQFDLSWALVDFHLERLTAPDHLWEPAAHCWTVRPGADGTWQPDWQVPEPDPPPVPTIAWLTWHVGWCWSVTIDHAYGRAPRDRSEIAWPGDGSAAVAWLRGLCGDWRAVLEQLTDAELDVRAPFPWQDCEHTVAHMLGWVNAELMKSGAEIGQLRMLRAAVER